MKQLDELVEYLRGHKRVTFSFFDESGRPLTACVRECEEFDFVEYGEEYAAGEMFEIAPSNAIQNVIVTQLVFADVHVAGNALLRRQAALLGKQWNDS